MASPASLTRTEPIFDDGAGATVTDAVPTAPKDSFGSVEATLAKLAQQAAIAEPDMQPRAAGPDTSADARSAPSSRAPTPGPATPGSATPGSATPGSATLGAATLGAATQGPATLGPATSGPATPGAGTLGAADLSTHFALEQRSSGKRRTLVRVAFLVALGASAFWAWRSYGGPAREVIAAFIPRAVPAAAQPTADQPAVPQTAEPVPNSAPNPAPPSAPSTASTQAAAPAAAEMPAPPAQTAPTVPPAAAPAAASADHQQVDAMAHDVAALRQTVEKLTAGQEQLKGEIAKLQAEKVAAAKPPPAKPKKHVTHHVSPADRPHDAFDPALDPRAPGAPRTIGSVVQRRPAPPPSSAYPVSTNSLPPPPGAPEPRRPPAPVPMPQY